MDRFEASIAPLERLRHSLGGFRSCMAEMMDGAQRELRRAQAALEETERYWRREVERRNAAAQDCYREQAAAAAQGGHVDCSGHMRALEEAEAEAARIVRARDRLDRAADRHRSARRGYADILEHAIGRADAYLSACILGFTAYRSEAFTHPALSASLRAATASRAPAPGDPGPPPGTERPVGGGTPERREGGEHRESEPRSRS